MFGRNPRDIGVAVDRMIEQAKIECGHNQHAMARQIGEWMADDRRFDDIKNKAGFAANAIDARSHGREIEIADAAPQYSPNAGQRVAEGVPAAFLMNQPKRRGL